MRLKAIIIDDFKPKITALMEMINFHCPNEVQIVGTFNNILDAMDFIRNESFDFIFLDVLFDQRERGLEFLSRYTNGNRPFEVVIYSDYDRYACDAFNNFDIAYYLIPPVRRQKLLEAVVKVRDKMLKKLKFDFSSIFEIGERKFDCNDILYFEASDGDNYIKVNNIEGFIKLPKKKGNSLDDIELRLPKIIKPNAAVFNRNHKKHIVNLLHVLDVDKTKNKLTLNNGRTLPVSQRKKGQFFRTWSAYCL